MSQQSLKDIFNMYSNGTGDIFKNKNILTEKHFPGDIIHREMQINQLAKIIAPSINRQKVSNIFLFGTVGTGKTLVTKKVTCELMEASGNVEVVYINCKMKGVSDTEYRLLAELCRNFGEEVPHTGLATDQIYKKFFSLLESKKKSIILILDEIDVLVKKIGDGILYNILRVNQDLKDTNLSIIGISNDISFTENMDPRVKSSLSEEEIIFPPYNASQLKDILMTRAGEGFKDNVVENGVIEKCAALAAQEHGDARKALDLLRMSGEIAERSSSPKVRITHVDHAENRLDVDRTIAVVRSQPKQSLAVIAAIIRLVEDGYNNIQTGDVFNIYEKICANRGLKFLTQRRISDLIAELDMLGVINTRVISKGRHGRTREIRIMLPKQTIDNIKKILEENYLIDNLYKYTKKEE